MEECFGYLDFTVSGMTAANRQMLVWLKENEDQHRHLVSVVLKLDPQHCRVAIRHGVGYVRAEVWSRSFDDFNQGVQAALEGSGSAVAVRLVQQWQRADRPAKPKQEDQLSVKRCKFDSRPRPRSLDQLPRKSLPMHTVLEYLR